MDAALMRLACYLAILFCWQWASAATSAVTTPVITLDQPYYHLAGKVEYYEDYSKALVPEDLARLPQSNWQLATGSAIYRGPIDAVIWIRLVVQSTPPAYVNPQPTPIANSPPTIRIPSYTAPNTAPTTWQLVTNNASLLDVRLFRQDQDQHWQELPNGGDAPVDYQQAPNQAHIFSLPLNQNGIEHFLMRVDPHTTALIPLLLLPKSTREQWSLHRYTITALYYGATTIMLICFLIMSIGARNKVYALYTLHLCCILLFNMNMDGFIKEQIYSGTYLLAVGNCLLASLVQLTGIQFTCATLNTKQRAPLLHRLGTIMSLLVVFDILSLTFLPLMDTIKLVLVLAVLINLLLVYTSIRVYLLGYREVRFFVMGWTAFMVFTIAAALNQSGLLPWTPLMAYYVHLGNFIETIFLSISLIDQLNFHRKKQILAEQEMKAALQITNQQLTRSNNVKDSFIATISHELRTPMHGILGALSLVNRASLSSDNRMQLDTIDVSAHTMNRLVDDLINFSELTTSNIPARKQLFALDNLRQHIQGNCLAKARSKGLQFEVRLTNTANKKICSDESKLTALLFQLTDNAVKFTEQGSVTVSIALTDSHGTATSQYGDGELHLVVTDTGTGIDPALLGELYQPFEQADNSFHRRYGGIGIGLALCKKIVDFLGGSIRVESTRSHGTQVQVIIPVAVAEASPPKASTKASPKVEPHPCPSAPSANEWHSGLTRALIVEDNPINQKILAAMLKKLGIKATLARNGKEGAELCASNKFDIVFMDCQMPVMDGFESTRLIREPDTLNSTTPIVAVTANASDGDRQRCQDVGMNNFMKKPVQLEDIRTLFLHYFPQLLPVESDSSKR